MIIIHISIFKANYNYIKTDNVKKDTDKISFPFLHHVKLCNQRISKVPVVQKTEYFFYYLEHCFFR